MSEQVPSSANSRGDSPADTGDPIPLALTVVVVVAVVAGVVTRFVTTSSLWLDEALSVNIASLPIGDIGEALRHDGHPPLYYVLLHGWIEVFGSGDVAVRSLSGVIAVACLPLAYLAGRRRGGHTAGLITLAVFAAAPFAIRYGTETRMYSLVILLVLIGYLLLDDIVVRGKGGVARLVAVTVVTAALLYTHYWSMWLLTVVGIGLLWGTWRTEGDARRRRVQTIGALVVGGALFLPWVPSLLYQSEHTGTPWAEPMRPFAAAATALGDFGGGGFRDADLIGSLLLVLALLAIFGIAVDRATIQLDLRTVTQYRREAMIVVGTFAIGIAATFAAHGTFATRYAAVFFPLFVILVAGGITRFAGKWVQVGALACIVASGSLGAYWSVTFSRSQTAALANAVREIAQPGDLVVYCPDQLGPGGTRVMPDDVIQLRFPDLGDPRFVDWVDYADRKTAIDPAEVATRSLDRAQNRGIFVVWSGGYRTMEGVCEAFVAALSAQRPGSVSLVSADSPSNYEHGELVYFPPAP